MTLLLLAGGSVASTVDHPKRLVLAAPKDGAHVGKRPRFLFGVVGGDLETLRFKITLSKDEGKTFAYTFNEVEALKGWAAAELDDKTPALAYYARDAVADGEYQWSVSSWDGRTWKQGSEHRRLRVDSVPPADVVGVQMTRDETKGCVRISWQPVTKDRNGGLESVATYRVYRDAADGPGQPVRPVQIIDTTDLEFTDCDAEAIGKPVLSYRVIALDEAGNASGQKF